VGSHHLDKPKDVGFNSLSDLFGAQRLVDPKDVEFGASSNPYILGINV
jgi:hypothetical protein